MTTTSSDILKIVDVRDFRERVRILLLAHTRTRAEADLAVNQALATDTLARIAAVRRIDADERLLRCICALILCRTDMIANSTPSRGGDDIADEAITADIETYLLVWAAT
ncbi:MAG: hypothetical protein WAS21_06785 [Geminicoccaceae bacterium]